LEERRDQESTTLDLLETSLAQLKMARAQEGKTRDEKEKTRCRLKLRR
jgi:hypothetical protein